MSTIPLALIGFGNVGQALAQLLITKQAELDERYDLRARVVAIATGRHGSALAPAGIDLARALELIKAGQSIQSLSHEPVPDGTLALIQTCQAQVLFENTPVDYHSGQPALNHLRAGLEADMHVITANKGPVVHGYQSLLQLAEQQGRRFFFESTVMDGAPVFSLWRQALPGAQLQSVRGLLNSTTNLILGLMEAGNTFEQAVAHAQSIGIAETDPSGDIDGWDAAIKLAAISTVLMDHPLLPSDVARTGISHLTEAAVAEALAQGKRWKLVCTAVRRDQGVHAEVKPEQVGPEDPLFAVAGTSSAITFHSDVLGPLTLTEQDPGPETTAYGLLADFLQAIL